MDDTPVRMVVDAEHVGIRTIMPVLAVAGLIGGFVLGNLVAPLVDEALSSLCLSLIFAAIGLVTLTYVGERFIKPLWSSGRVILVDRSRLQLLDKRRKPPQESTIEWDNPLQVQAWYFEVPTRRSRVPKGWYCVSIRLVQDEQKLILYSFLKPEAAEESVPRFNDWFVKLFPKKEREQITDVQKAARQERFRRLEDHRWHDGAELSAEDFLVVMTQVDRHGQLTTPTVDA